ncbi:MAG TPA: MDR family MFS transporter [Dehalococcoidia bacterium]|nr:MDR family MFS transporter [Dehalococcoidia bacterium]
MKDMNRILIVAALMFAIAISAMDSTIVATATPTIVGSLGGLSLFSWVFSVYLLTSTVTVPLYGKLADIYGRKPILLFGCTLFLIGSALCGASQSMEQLILFRALQGAGAGAVQPITMTVIGDIFTIEERAKIQGLFSSVWGVTSLAGPAIGGLLTQGLSWRWVFYINLPIGLMAIFLLWRFFKEQAERHEHVIDYFGTVLLSGAVVCLLLALLQGVDSYGWLGAETLVLLGLCVAFLGGFIAQERRAIEPVLPLWLFKNRVIAVSCMAVFVGGGLMFGVSSYVPLFTQGVLGGDAFDAGLMVLPMSISWPIASIIGGRVILRVGYYASTVIGGVFLIMGATILLFADREASQFIPAIAAFVVGFGMGFTTSALIISVQNAVEWRYRGVATASTQFFRTIGGSISVAIMGAILNGQLSSRFADVPGVPPGATEATLLNVQERASLPEQVLANMQQALSDSLHEIYLFVLLLAILAFCIALIFPRGRAEDLAVGATQSSEPQPQRQPAPAGIIVPDEGA